MMSTTNGNNLEGRNLLPGTEELKRSGSSGSTANDEAQQHQLHLQQRSVAKNRIRPEHPAPKNKDARKHMARLRTLGYNNFNEIEVDYWEPAKAGEEKSQHMARRQRECLAMNNLLDRMEAKAGVNKSLAARNNVMNNSNDNETSIVETQEEEILSLRKLNQTFQERQKQLEARLEEEIQLKLKAERKAQEEENMRKTQYSLIKDQLQPGTHGEVTDQRQQMLENKLEQQTSQLKELTATVDEQSKKINDLTSKYNRLCQKYKEGKEENNTLKSHLEAALEENKSLKTAFETQGADDILKLSEELEKSKAKNMELEKELQQAALADTGDVNINVENQCLIQTLEELLDKKLEEKLQKIVKPQIQLQNLHLKHNNLEVESDMDTPITELDGFTFKRRRKGRGNSIDTVDTMDSAVRNRRKPTYSQASRGNNRGQTEKPGKAPRGAQQSEGTRSAGQKLRKVLILPEADKKVVQSMREKKLRARELGVNNVVEFPSGAALLLIEEQNANDTIKKLEEVGLQQKPQPRLHETNTFKVHDIPEGNTEKDIEEEIHNILGIKPEKVILLNYKDPKKKNVRLGVVEGGKSLIEVVKNRKSIFIDYRHCRVDTKPNLMRCKTCNLLGHTKNNCEGIPAALLLDYQQQQGKACLDCLAFNKRMSLAGFSTNRYRFTDHELDSRECPTKKAFLKKMSNRPIRGPSQQDNHSNG